MNEWLDTHVLYWHWIVIGLIMLAAEMFIPAFFMLWLGASAIVVGLVMLVVNSMPFSIQVLLWTGLSVIFLLVWFRYLSPIMKTKSLSGMALENLVGKSGTVIEHSTETTRGKIRFSAPLLGNDEWEVICEQSLKPGDRAQVIEVSGNSLVVKKI